MCGQRDSTMHNAQQPNATKNQKEHKKTRISLVSRIFEVLAVYIYRT